MFDLGDLIKELEKLPQDKVVENGFGEAMSWRGSYYELAFEPMKSAKISDMLNEAEVANGRVFEGYKGGHFTMRLSSEVHIAHYGEIGEPITMQHIESWSK